MKIHGNRLRLPRRLRIGDRLPDLSSRNRKAILRWLGRVYPDYRFRLELPRGRCRRSGLFHRFVPVVTAIRWRTDCEEYEVTDD